MKKILILIALISLTACTSNKQGFYDENSAPDNLGLSNDQEVMKRIEDIKNGATPVVKNKKNTKTPPPPSNNSQNKQPQQIQLDDLTKEFSKAKLKTNFGDVTIELYSAESPVTVNNFLNLAKKGFYNDTKFHRVISDFMIQGGDPLSKDDDWKDDGTGGPGYKFQDEFNSKKLVKGSLAMANSGPNTNGSQFFIVTKESTPWLDGKHTNFGRVVEGMEVVDAIEAVETNERDHPLKDVVIESIELIK